MLVASIGIPLLLNGLQMPAEPSHQAEENAARVAAAEAAIAAFERIEHARAEGRPDADLYVAAASRIMDTYPPRIESRRCDAETIATNRVLEQIVDRKRTRLTSSP